MARTINRARDGKSAPKDPCRDELLVHAYINRGPDINSPLHPRRTLDQFFYYGIDTSHRDVDQVVWRYCKNHRPASEEVKLLMVDQLWMWIMGSKIAPCLCEKHHLNKRNQLIHPRHHRHRRNLLPAALETAQERSLGRSRCRCHRDRVESKEPLAYPICIRARHDYHHSLRRDLRPSSGRFAAIPVLRHVCLLNRAGRQRGIEAL